MGGFYHIRNTGWEWALSLIIHIFPFNVHFPLLTFDF